MVKVGNKEVRPGFRLFLILGLSLFFNSWICMMSERVDMLWGHSTMMSYRFAERSSIR